MTLPLPDPKVDQQAWELERQGVQRNFESLAQAFPLECSTTSFRQVPQVQVSHNTTNSLNNNSPTALAFNTETYDLGTSAGMHDTVTNNSRLTIRVAGLYVVTGTICWTANATGVRGAGIGKNGNVTVWQLAPTVAGADTPRNCIVDHLRLAVGDYLELFGYQTSGGALTTTSAETSFKACWVSP